MNSDSASRPIPTPFRVRWGLFRSRWLPVVTMTLCAVLSVLIWTRVTAWGQAVGEVERVRVSLSSAVDGRVGFVDGRQVTLLQHVDDGQIVARLDDTLIKNQIAGVTAEMKLLQEQIDAAVAAGSADAAAAGRLAALRAAKTAKEEHLGQLDLKLDSLTVRAPFSGTVTAIHARPGQFVNAGQPIVDIAADHGTSVVAYLRAEQRVTPKVGMDVEVRTASAPNRVLRCKVESVGTQFDAVPARLLRDPKYPEWGLPVRITLPSDAVAKAASSAGPGTALAVPGEVVRIVFRSPTTAE